MLDMSVCERCGRIAGETPLENRRCECCVRNPGGDPIIWEDATHSSVALTDVGRFVVVSDLRGGYVAWGPDYISGPLRTAYLMEDCKASAERAIWRRRNQKAGVM